MTCLLSDWHCARPPTCHLISYEPTRRCLTVWESLWVELLFLQNERNQLRWFGHRTRMPPGQLQLQQYQVRFTGQRPWGKPGTCWRDYISHLAWECWKQNEWMNEIFLHTLINGFVCHFLFSEKVIFSDYSLKMLCRLHSSVTQGLL